VKSWSKFKLDGMFLAVCVACDTVLGQKVTGHAVTDNLKTVIYVFINIIY